jgi:hypothetical protein
MTPVSLFALALGSLVVAAGALTLLVPVRTRRGAAALDSRDPGDPLSRRMGRVDQRPFGRHRETLVRGFTMVVLGLVALLLGVSGL